MQFSKPTTLAEANELIEKLLIVNELTHSLLNVCYMLSTSGEWPGQCPEMKYRNTLIVINELTRPFERTITLKLHECKHPA